MENVTEIEEVTHPRGRSRNGASTPNTVVIGPRDDLKGTLSVEGDVRIEGTVEGEVRATGDIEIDASATVRARLEGRGVAVRGNVTGDVVAWKRLSVPYQQSSGPLIRRWVRIRSADRHAYSFARTE